MQKFTAKFTKVFMLIPFDKKARASFYKLAKISPLGN